MVTQCLSLFLVNHGVTSFVKVWKERIFAKLSTLSTIESATQNSVIQIPRNNFLHWWRSKTPISNNAFGNNRRIKNIIHQPFQKLSRKTLSIHESQYHKIHYPPSYASLSHKQYDSLHKVHIPNAIYFLGYNRTWSSTLRFGCHKYSSLQLKDM